MGLCRPGLLPSDPPWLPLCQQHHLAPESEVLTAGSVCLSPVLSVTLSPVASPLPCPQTPLGVLVMWRPTHRCVPCSRGKQCPLLQLLEHGVCGGVWGHVWAVHSIVSTGSRLLTGSSVLCLCPRTFLPHVVWDHATWASQSTRPHAGCLTALEGSAPVSMNHPVPASGPTHLELVL